MSNEARAWIAYLQYLKDWADSHTDHGFIGTCPACYDEWLDCEGKEYAKMIWPDYEED